MGIVPGFSSTTDNDYLALLAGDVIDSPILFEGLQVAIGSSGASSAVSVGSGSAIDLGEVPGFTTVGVYASGASTTVDYAGALYLTGIDLKGILLEGKGSSVDFSGYAEAFGDFTNVIAVTGADVDIDVSGFMLSGGFLAEAIATAGINTTITTTGTIETFGAFSNAILAYEDGADITMGGEIITSGFQADAIANLGDDASISVAGNIQTFGEYADGILNFGDEAAIEVSGNMTTFGFGANHILNVGDFAEIVVTGNLDAQLSSRSIFSDGVGSIVDISGSISVGDAELGAPAVYLINSLSLDMSGSVTSQGGLGIATLLFDSADISGSVDVTGGNVVRAIDAVAGQQLDFSGMIEVAGRSATGIGIDQVDDSTIAGSMVVTGEDFFAAGIQAFSSGTIDVTSIIDVTSDSFSVGMLATESYRIDFGGTMDIYGFEDAKGIEAYRVAEVDVTGTIEAEGDFATSIYLEEFYTLDVSGNLSATGGEVGGAINASYGYSVSISGDVSAAGAFTSTVGLFAVEMIDISGNVSSEAGLNGVAVNAAEFFDLNISGNISTTGGTPSTGVVAQVGESFEFSGIADIETPLSVGVVALSVAHTEVSGEILASSFNSSGLFVDANNSFGIDPYVRNTGRIMATGMLFGLPGVDVYSSAVVLQFSYNGFGDKSTIEFVNSGEVISSANAGIFVSEPVFAPGGGTATIHNQAGGLIQGLIGIQGHDGIEMVINEGRIVGDVLLAGGDDTFHASGASRVEGVVDGGAGNDMITGSNGKDVFLGGEGDDTISGGNGNDDIAGGEGNDTMTGGNGADRFFIEANSGTDTITDFGSEDTIAFGTGSGASSYSDLSIVDTVDGAVVSWGGADSILLQGVTSAELNPGQFLFGVEAPTQASTLSPLSLASGDAESASMMSALLELGDSGGTTLGAATVDPMAFQVLGEIQEETQIDLLIDGIAGESAPQMASGSSSIGMAELLDSPLQTIGALSSTFNLVDLHEASLTVEVA